MMLINRGVSLSLLLVLTVSMHMSIVRGDVEEEDYDEEIPSLESELRGHVGDEGRDALAYVAVDEAAGTSEAPVQDGSAVGLDLQLRQQAFKNGNAVKSLAGVMSDLLTETTSHKCLGSDEKTQRLTNTIKEGFSILVGAVQDLNTTMQHYKTEINKMAFKGSPITEEAFEDDGPCPSPFFLAGDDCIYIETEHLRYFDAARQACVDMGAKLAEFTTFEPFIAAVSEMDLHDEAEIYVGGTDEEEEQVWRWLSGGRIEGIPWHSDEPNNGGGRENCLSYKARTKTFNDVPCFFRREYACMKK